MFTKILIANRGEIACRVIQTAQKLGIRTVAVYSEADKNARHVAMADEAIYLGPAPAKDSYLKTDLIIKAAKDTGAQAIHPGYGFLSENADFAKTCADNNIEFIGPPEGAIIAMGSKSAAKEIMEEAGVPLVKGYHGENQDPDFLKSQADDIGYPVIIKATAGGGGKGMRIVWKAEEFESSLASCKRESAASFGDDKVLVEKYITKPRHVEIQVFADKHGNAVHLFERDCSVQRRHQKVIEEAPAPGMSEDNRQQMGEVAIRAAKAIGYVGAGTVEFLYDEDGSFYFMEMNTRLQVEHPVTEKITGQDLVEWQLKVASGQELPEEQENLSINGHAFEVRIYAEDPRQDFLPATGSLLHLNTPEESEHIRIDTGVRQGDTVSVHYDPMIAKLIVWDHDRNAALARLRGALAQYQVVGLTTNVEFLSALASNQAFEDCDLDTNFIERFKDELILEDAPADEDALVAATVYQLVQRQQTAKESALKSADPYSPWNQVSGWRLNTDNHHAFEYLDYVDSIPNDVVVTTHFRGDEYLLELPEKELKIHTAELNGNNLRLDAAGKRFNATVVDDDKNLHVFVNGNYQILEKVERGQAGESEEAGGSLTAPMPGTVIEVKVSEGDTVEAGQPLIILEAMKMEHTINAPTAGTVAEVLYGAGDLVNDGAELLILDAGED
ncbi:acetyl/propionyl/methylcrotonyl-CoA carboxylase subunit alpha [Kangiella sediminilitoris]|uniref:Biotin carboxylase n=1 Tax=Kangiella sediminilitoris TaxID=1144748 RepID=A0A1B3BB39_9GAMM|nr:acetyl/propionyl/methylcrotonyl-CoA carboxylase subunit alpha [Kangiella sediminilitoris]AOE50010.1 3-methylcrotonyl-CoA carboxylase subunit alpha [Kangiella sediminilitoris]